jgi:hypothetical protein
MMIQSNSDICQILSSTKYSLIGGNRLGAAIGMRNIAKYVVERIGNLSDSEIVRLKSNELADILNDLASDVVKGDLNEIHDKLCDCLVPYTRNVLIPWLAQPWLSQEGIA